MIHRTSPQDDEFRLMLERLEVGPDEFDHRAHVRLAYIYLCSGSVEEARISMKQALLSFLGHLGADTSRYHETVTASWILAVRHFMELSVPCASADEFIDRNAALLDTGIMLTHYSAEVLFSPEARSDFVEPDVEPIPRHD